MESAINIPVKTIEGKQYISLEDVQAIVKQELSKELRRATSNPSYRRGLGLS